MTSNMHRSHVTLFSVDEAIEHCVIARRNFYLGLWAGRTLELTDDALQRYARGVVEADYEEPGHGDVVRKLLRDFATTGRQMARQEIERQLRRSHAIAVQHFAMSD